MMADDLTADQAGVVGWNDGALLVLAGPGSGKTRVLTRRIIRLLQDSPNATFRILALTFTNRAADRMRDQVRDAVGDLWRRALLTTFHAFALDVLQRHGGHIDLPPNLTIYERPADLAAILVQALRDEGFVQSVPAKAVNDGLFRISRCKHELIGPAAARGMLVPGISLAAAFAAYDAALRRFGAVDLDDLLVLCHHLFTEVPRVVALYRRLYRYILVDEAQDSNRAQYQLLRALCGDEQRNVMMVADGDQHIYGFTGASHRYLKMFVRDFSAEERTLAVNFRCDPEIVATANRLIGRNTDRMPRPDAVSNRSPVGGAVALRELVDEEAEARSVADDVEGVLADGSEGGRVAPRDLAVLGRNRYVLDATRVELASRRIPVFFRTTEDEIVASRQGRVLYLALHVLHNAADLPRVAAMAQTLGLKGWTVDSAEADGHLRDARSVLVGLGAGASPGWGHLLDPLVAQAASGSQARLAGYLPALLTVLESEVRPQDRELAARDAGFLRGRFADYRATLADSEPDLGGFLAHLALSAAADGDGVRVLTVHASKGLEFHAVWLVGMNQGAFPDYRSLQEEGGEALEEERRAAYVAVTRAARRLTLTRARKRAMPWGDEKPQRPSQFLAEMGVEPPPEPAHAAEGRSTWRRP